MSAGWALANSGAEPSGAPKCPVRDPVTESDERVSGQVDSNDAICHCHERRPNVRGPRRVVYSADPRPITTDRATPDSCGGRFRRLPTVDRRNSQVDRRGRGVRETTSHQVTGDGRDRLTQCAGRDGFDRDQSSVRLLHTGWTHRNLSRAWRGTFPNLPEWKSRNACSISAWLFMTNGPPIATDCRIG
jgi:hypothetical protein